MTGRRQDSTWRASPSAVGRLLIGLWLFGAGVALIVLARLGADPWTVLAEGVAQRTPLTLGGTIIAIGIAVLLLWIPLRERPGLGTVANVVVIGVAVDATLAILPSPGSAATRTGSLLAGIALIGLGSGLYLGARLGPGPRDGLMTGLHRVTGRPVWQVRAGLEGAVLATGWALGGTVGIGTVAFAVLIGPSVDAGMRLTGAARPMRLRADLGDAAMITVPEAARLLGRNPETIRRWIRAGRLRSQRVGTQHLVDEEAVRAVMDVTPLDLPDAWAADDTGRQKPPWEQLVRDSRGSH